MIFDRNTGIKIKRTGRGSGRWSPELVMVRRDPVWLEVIFGLMLGFMIVGGAAASI